MASKKAEIAWVPLESNPEVMNQFIHNLGVSELWGYNDVWGLDEDLLQMVPQPCVALLLLFPITPGYEKFRLEESKKLHETGQPLSDKVYFMKQTIRNACGSIAVLHSLANTMDKIEILEGPLKNFLAKTQSLNPDDRAKTLETSGEIAQAHQATAQGGQTEAPNAEDDIDLHFICFIERDGEIYELDGRKPFPINHGKCTSLLKDGAKVIKQFMERDPDLLQFTVLALAPNQSF
ncbi:peptidase C12, ubiquitin carboxyl-terminal hydrolase 1 [Basidiobolus meristosporus CBS 931.73]|uniref:Ubiquitin carboxyl-terminal hydrolase n=1 Tax=Basidiobolus meristosporus CBS 931.73 TaxID=1314790 RepID=A0A1Y1XSX9_9FUNG|nr:peptidase C12, ubiquitin carboxyl-terminal hydrolase 1 [Basidiobolus meristosporus CBS 931.73]|eukprot:ORX88606.1 peptidase C12, ubiquitin carboxyl-terminal hydrolase 1 [Basidiobolus meristosporus CBS 931.73]